MDASKSLRRTLQMGRMSSDSMENCQVYTVIVWSIESDIQDRGRPYRYYRCYWFERRSVQEGLSGCHPWQPSN